MMVNDTCVCGAKFNATSTWNNGAVIERHNEWLRAHTLCRASDQYKKIASAERKSP